MNSFQRTCGAAGSCVSVLNTTAFSQYPQREAVCRFGRRAMYCGGIQLIRESIVCLGALLSLPGLSERETAVGLHGNQAVCATAFFILVICSLHTQSATAHEVQGHDNQFAQSIDAASSPKNTEYAFRWLAPLENFSSAAQTAEWLVDNANLKKEKSKEAVEVRYFAIEQAKGLGAFKASLRRRGEGEYNYKVRGPAPATRAAMEEAKSTCKGDVDEELDVAIALGLPNVTAAALSCNHDSRHNLSVLIESAKTPRLCIIQMERVELSWIAFPKRKEIKVEQWTFKPKNGPDWQLLEISWKANATAEDESAFRDLIRKLPNVFRGEVPQGKEKTAEACDASYF